MEELERRNLLIWIEKKKMKKKKRRTVWQNGLTKQGLLSDKFSFQDDHTMAKNFRIQIFIIFYLKIYARLKGYQMLFNQ